MIQLIEIIKFGDLNLYVFSVNFSHLPHCFFKHNLMIILFFVLSQIQLV